MKSLENNKKNFLIGKSLLLQKIEKKRKKFKKNPSEGNIENNIQSKNEKFKHSRNKSNVNFHVNNIYKKKLIKDNYKGHKRCISDFPLSSKKNIKSAPPVLFKGSNTLYTRKKLTPRKYLISLESDHL